MFNKICVIVASVLVTVISIIVCFLACAGILTISTHLSVLTPRQELAAAMGFSVFLFIGLVGTWFEHILPKLTNKGDSL